MKEEWRDIKGYEGKYQVSNLGRVKSLNYHRENREKILNYTSKKNGYIQVKLCKGGNAKHFKVHRLVAEAFIPNPNNYPIINHKDENKSNNKVSNLEWCTYSYNTNYGSRAQKFSEKMKGREFTEEHKKKISESRLGSKHPQARKVLCVTTGEEFNCIKEAAEHYNLYRESISACCRGKQKSTGKHPITGEKLKWKYID